MAITFPLTGMHFLSGFRLKLSGWLRCSNRGNYVMKKRDRTFRTDSGENLVRSTLLAGRELSVRLTIFEHGFNSHRSLRSNSKFKIINSKYCPHDRRKRT